MPVEWIFIELFVNIVEVGALYYLLCSKFPAKRKTFVPTLCFVVGNISLLMVSTFVSFGNLPIAEILLPVSTLLYLLLFRNGSALKKFFWTFIAYAVMALLAFFAMSAIAMNMGVSSAATIAPNSNELLLTMILAKTSQVVIFYVLAKRKKSFESDNFLSVAPILACLVVPFLSILMIFFINGIIHNDTKTLDELVFAVSVSYLAINIIVFVLYEFISREAKKNYTLTANQQKYEITEQHNDEILKIYSSIREWRHDYANHMMAVIAFLENPGGADIEKAVEYIRTLDEKIKPSPTTVSTGNYIVDAIVSAKLALAQSSGTRFEYNIVLTKALPIDDTDLCAMLSNLLDNAVEACGKVEGERYIKVDIFVIRSQLHIEITNSTDGKYRRDGLKFKTTKQGQWHGIGMKQIESVVGKYKGMCDVTADGTSFSTRIGIPLTERQEQMFTN